MDTHNAAVGDAEIGQEEQQDDPSSGLRASPKLQRAPSEQQEWDGAKRGEGSSAESAESAQSERMLTPSAEDGEAGASLPPQAQEVSGDGAPPTLGTLESIEVKENAYILLLDFFGKSNPDLDCLIGYGAGAAPPRARGPPRGPLRRGVRATERGQH